MSSVVKKIEKLNERVKNFVPEIKVIKHSSDQYISEHLEKNSHRNVMIISIYTGEYEGL